MNNYENTWQQSNKEPDRFWLAAASKIDWVEAPTIGWDENKKCWFPDGILNSCHNAVDRHVENGSGEQAALIYESPVTDQRESYTYHELRERVAQTAGMIAAAGVGKGDRVIIYMPMIPETVFAMLACARIGAVHSVVFGGFAAPELAKRIDDAEPKLLLTASGGMEGQKVIEYKPLVDQAIALAKFNIADVILLNRRILNLDLTGPQYDDWSERLKLAEPADCVPVQASDPLYVLYTSGTTGTPKGVVRDNGGHAVALNWSMKAVYGLESGETFWAASDVGWVVGHSYIVYAPLFAGATTVLYEGKPIGTPDAGEFWRVMDRNNVAVFFTAPTAVRAIRKEDGDGSFFPDNNLPNLRAIFLAGERADPDTVHWLGNLIARPVIDHWWQTELGWPAIATCLGLGDKRSKAGSAGFPVPGHDFRILDENGDPVDTGKSGSITIAVPLAPGCYQSLWNNFEGFEKAFATFPGHYETGDAGYCDENGFLHVMGRTDDIINVAGHRLSTGQMEGLLCEVDGVSECAVVGADNILKGTVPVAFVVAGSTTDEQSLIGHCISHVRNELGAVASVKIVHIVPALPKTRSGKILRATLRAITNGETAQTPSTIENPASLDAIAHVVKEHSHSQT